MNGRIKIKDGTTWFDPTSKRYIDVSRKMIHNRKIVTETDMLFAAEAMRCYSELILNPVLTLKDVQKKVSMIRKAIKE